MKKKKMLDGSIFKISINKDYSILVKNLKDGSLAIYDYKFPNNDIPDMQKNEELRQNPAAFYLLTYPDFGTSERVEFICIQPTSIEEIKKIPPFFTQDIQKVNVCKLYYFDGSDKIVSVTARDCVGLEAFIVYSEESVIIRIEDYFNGKESFITQRSKVRLK